MSQDYFLKRTYDAVYKANKAKSPFRTLSESYRLVLEEKHQQVPLLINPKELSNGSWSDAQKRLYDLTSKNRETSATEATDEIPIGADEYVVQDKKGKPLRTTGMGPGELAVVSVITGSTDPEYCIKYLSGGNKDYDVTWPPKEKNPTYIFEVKDIQLGSARVAKHGDQYTKKVTSLINDILDHIVDEFETLTKEDKDKVNSELKDGILDLLQGIKPKPEPITYKNKRTDPKTGQTYKPGEETLPSRRAREAYEQRYEPLKSNWSIVGWARNIRANTREIPHSVVFGKDEQSVVRGDRPIFVSIQTMLNVIDALEHSLVEDKGSEPKETDNKERRINDLIRTFKHHYKASTPEKNLTLDNVIDATVKQVDKKLLKIKAKETNESEYSWRDFFHNISKENLDKKLSRLEEEMQSQSSILSLFPSSITGLFFVNEKGYNYIPKDYLHEYVYIETISMGGPKITLKRKKNNET